MKIKITDTNKIETLEIIDPATGTNWINDLMGNHGELPDYDEDSDTYELNQACFNWWEDVAEKLQTANYRLHEIRRILTDAGNEELNQDLSDGLDSADLDMHSYIINEICNKIEDEKRKRCYL
jgi:hypothetical protein